MKIIDLRSDTVTLPPAAMREAMHAAALGDDVYDEDPTVNELQIRVAKLLGKEAALFVASGTMGNLIALLSQCQRGEQAIVGSSSHICVYEQGSASSLGGISLKPVQSLADGSLDLGEVRRAINVDNVHFAKTSLIAIENTWHGHVLSASYMRSLFDLTRQNRLLLHLDGARIFNAALALKLPVSDLAQFADSIQLCFSKGLSAPVGSMVAGSAEFIYRAKRWRKALGGGMRQVGVLAAACNYALDHMVERLQEDHDAAAMLAEGLSQVADIQVEIASPRTNMVFFQSMRDELSNEHLVTRLKAKGVLMSPMGEHGIRAVTHYGVGESEVDLVVNEIKSLFSH